MHPGTEILFLIISTIVVIVPIFLQMFSLLTCSDYSFRDVFRSKHISFASSRNTFLSLQVFLRQCVDCPVFTIILNKNFTYLFNPALVSTDLWNWIVLWRMHPRQRQLSYNYATSCAAHPQRIMRSVGRRKRHKLPIQNYEYLKKWLTRHSHTYRVNELYEWYHWFHLLPYFIHLRDSTLLLKWRRWLRCRLRMKVAVVVGI